MVQFFVAIVYFANRMYKSMTVYLEFLGSLPLCIRVWIANVIKPTIAAQYRACTQKNIPTPISFVDTEGGSSRPEYFNFSIVTFDGFSNNNLYRRYGVPNQRILQKNANFMRKIELQLRILIHLCAFQCILYWYHFWTNYNAKIRHSKSISPENKRLNIEKRVGTLFQVTKRYEGKNQCSLQFISARRQAGNIQFLRAHFMADRTHESENHMWKAKGGTFP